jgi:hypothetical protein
MATSTLQVNDKEDLFLPDGRNLSVLVGAAACMQNIRQKTKMRTTEDIYNVNNGVDYLGTVFTPQQSYDAARKSLSNAILSCPDVQSIESLTITITGNTFDYVADIMTLYGPLQVSS